MANIRNRDNISNTPSPHLRQGQISTPLHLRGIQANNITLQLLLASPVSMDSSSITLRHHQASQVNQLRMRCTALRRRPWARILATLGLQVGKRRLISLAGILVNRSMAASQGIRAVTDSMTVSKDSKAAMANKVGSTTPAMEEELLQLQVGDREL